jgi:Flp pilus assembly protein TadG
MKNPARLRILRKADHGSSLVELALVIPILLLIVFGAVDFGHAFYVNLELVNAAHAGAEYGSLNPTLTGSITTAAMQSAPNLHLTASAVTVQSGCVCSDGTAYHDQGSCSPAPACPNATLVNRVQVTTTTTYHTLVPWGVIPSSFKWSSTATIRGNR